MNAASVFSCAQLSCAYKFGLQLFAIEISLSICRYIGAMSEQQGACPLEMMEKAVPLFWLSSFCAFSRKRVF
jgi:hypothetical protein